MKLYIPGIGDTIKLTKPWKFKLYPEYRNIALGKYYKLLIAKQKWAKTPEEFQQIVDLPHPTVDRKYFYPDGDTSRYADFNIKAYTEAVKTANEVYKAELSKIGNDYIEITFPINTILKIDRVYIRKGFSAYSSITFYIKNLESEKKKPKAYRFWVKLSDCNEIEFEKIEE